MLLEFLAPEHKDPGKERVIPNLCLASGTKGDVKIGEGEDQGTFLMDGADIGGPESFAQLVMIKSSRWACKVKPCSYNGVYQPNLMDTLPPGEILLSCFYNQINPILPVDQREIRLPSPPRISPRVLTLAPPRGRNSGGPTRRSRKSWRAGLAFMYTSILTGLLNRDPSQRLGINGTEEIRRHPFFAQHIDFERLLQKKI